MCRFYHALDDEVGVDADDYCRFMTAYYNRMDPTQTARACGCCGAVDVPATDTTEADSEAMGILSFTTVSLPNDALRVGRHSCSGACPSTCPFLLDPLIYTQAEREAYYAPFPDHIVPPLGLEGCRLDAWRDEQQRDWIRFRRIISNVAVNAEGRAVSRVGFGPEMEPVDVTGSRLEGNRAPVLDSAAGPPARLLHLYPELCTGNETDICGPCMRALARRRRPEPSIAAGWDLGTPAYSDMPRLSWAEKRAVSKTRILSTAFNIDDSVARREGTLSCIHPSKLLYSVHSFDFRVQGSTIASLDTA